jgi:hypothetical protein
MATKDLGSLTLDDVSRGFQRKPRVVDCAYVWNFARRVSRTSFQSWWRVRLRRGAKPIIWRESSCLPILATV